MPCSCFIISDSLQLGPSCHLTPQAPPHTLHLGCHESRSSGQTVKSFYPPTCSLATPVPSTQHASSPVVAYADQCNLVAGQGPGPTSMATVSAVAERGRVGQPMVVAQGEHHERKKHSAPDRHSPASLASATAGRESMLCSDCVEIEPNGDAS